jgi:hypothetical protein
MNDNQRTLYQVSFMGWTPSAMVVASNLNEAIELAVTGKGSSATAVLAIDATQQWLELSERVKADTETLLTNGTRGVVEYVEGRGWVAA